MRLNILPGWYWTLLLALVALGIGLLAPDYFATQPENETDLVAQAPTETLLPATPLSTRTATSTLRPPPTIEPPTATPQPSATPTATPTESVFINATVEGIQGLPSPTVEGTEACEPREEWQLRYEVQPDDTLTSIADFFSTTTWELAEANCLDDADVIRIRQQLRVPGEAFPAEPAVECTGYEVLTPIDNAWDVPSVGQIVFNWRGPEAPRNLIRLYPPDYDFANPNPDRYVERTIDLRQNETFDLDELDIYEGEGIWHWQVYPLDLNFQQICPESPLWSFFRQALPTPTPTLTPSPALQMP